MRARRQPHRTSTSTEGVSALSRNDLSYGRALSSCGDWGGYPLDGCILRAPPRFDHSWEGAVMLICPQCGKEYPADFERALRPFYGTIRGSDSLARIEAQQWPSPNEQKVMCRKSRLTSRRLTLFKTTIQEEVTLITKKDPNTAFYLIPCVDLIAIEVLLFNYASLTGGGFS